MSLAKDVAEQLLFTYPMNDDKKMTKYLEHIRQLPVDAQGHPLQMSPFLIMMLLLFYLLPNPYKGFAILVALVFWVVWWIWNFIADKKKKI